MRTKGMPTTGQGGDRGKTRNIIKAPEDYLKVKPRRKGSGEGQIVPILRGTGPRVPRPSAPAAGLLLEAPSENMRYITDSRISAEPFRYDEEDLLPPESREFRQSRSSRRSHRQGYSRSPEYRPASQALTKTRRSRDTASHLQDPHQASRRPASRHRGYYDEGRPVSEEPSAHGAPSRSRESSRSTGLPTDDFKWRRPRKQPESRDARRRSDHDPLPTLDNYRGPPPVNRSTYDGWTTSNIADVRSHLLLLLNRSANALSQRRSLDRDAAGTGR